MVRGGAWNNNERNARCANRNRNNPDNRNDNNGFRVVVSMLFYPGQAVSLPHMPEVRRAHGFAAEAKKNRGAPSWLARTFFLKNRQGWSQANNSRPAPWVRPWRRALFHAYVCRDLLLG